MIAFKMASRRYAIYDVYRKSDTGLDKVATIRKGQAEWILESSTGRIDRFDTLKEAKAEALKI